MGQTVAFLLGGFLALQAFAALFLLIDLRYAAQRYWARIAGPIVGWMLVLHVTHRLLGPGFENAYLYGAITMVAAQVVNFLVARWLIGLAFRRRQLPSRNPALAKLEIDFFLRELGFTVEVKLLD